MKLFLVPGLLLAFCLSAAAQQDTWVETRFQRVYLKNGNFIDGVLVSQSVKEIVLKLPVGEMSIRTDQVDRMELVKMRSVNERLLPVPIAKGPSTGPGPDATRRDPLTRPPTPPTPSGDAVPEFPAAPETKTKVDALLAELARANPESKLSLMDRLADVGGDAGPYLASLLAKVDRQDISIVTAAIVRSKDKRAIPILGKHSQSDNGLIRTAAASALGGLADESALQYLLPLVKDKDNVVRSTVASALGEIKDRQSLVSVLTLLPDPDREVRSKAIQVGSDLSAKLDMGKDYIEALVRSLDEADVRAKFDLIGALGRTKSKEQWDKIAGYLRSDQSELRSIAASALGFLGATDANNALTAQAGVESDPRVRLSIAVTAKQLNITAAVGAMIPWLKDDTESVRTETLKTLEALTSQKFGLDTAKWDDWWLVNRPK